MNTSKALSAKGIERRRLIADDSLLLKIGVQVSELLAGLTAAKEAVESLWNTVKSIANIGEFIGARICC